MSSNPDHRAPVALSLTTPAKAAKERDGGAGDIDGGPPRRSKVAATLAVLAWRPAARCRS